MMALDKTFASGDILSAADVNSYLAGFWTPIDKRAIASGSPITPITWSSLDSNFRMFRITYHIFTGAASGLWLRLNNDSGSNYTQQTLIVSTTTVSGFRVTPAVAIDLAHGASGGTPLMGQILISKPLSTLAARGTILASLDATTSVLLHSDALAWNNTSSLINRIDLIGNAGAFYGIAALEGMRGV